MTAPEIIAFESSLAPGAPVTVRWTNSGRFFAVPGRVARVNAKSIAVSLEAAPSGTSYEPGQSINVPRFPARKWSTHNCVVPAGEFAGQVIA